MWNLINYCAFHSFLLQWLSTFVYKGRQRDGSGTYVSNSSSQGLRSVKTEETVWRKNGMTRRSRWKMIAPWPLQWLIQTLCRLANNTKLSHLTSTQQNVAVGKPSNLSNKGKFIGILNRSRLAYEAVPCCSTETTVCYVRQCPQSFQYFIFWTKVD